MPNRKAQAARTRIIELAKRDARTEVQTLLEEQGLEVVRGTLVPGHVGWDEPVINAIGYEGVPELDGHPRCDFDLYWQTFAAACRDEAVRVSDKTEARLINVHRAKPFESWERE